jgi:hypothetical protein
MNDEEKYLFDLNGFLVLPQVLSPDEVRRGNEAIDRHAGRMKEIGRSLARESVALQGTSRRLDLGGMLAWERPWCEPFRELLVHPRIRPLLSELLGNPRLDHGPMLIAMDKGNGGHYLHGGAVERQDFSQTYEFKYDRMFCGLTVVEFQLAAEGPGDGGLAIVPGSHKSHFPTPKSLAMYEQHRDYVKEIHTEPGDAVIFTEAVTHGTLVWQGEHQRRSLIYKYNTGSQAHGPGYHRSEVPDFALDMSDEQRALFRPTGQ